VDKLLEQLLTALGDIGNDHEEIYDTVVREHMGDAVMAGFIRPVASFEIPESFGMYSAGADGRIKRALAIYITFANEEAAKQGLLAFHDRLGAFQNEDVRSAHGDYYDDLFGYMDPDQFDSFGNVKT